MDNVPNPPCLKCEATNDQWADRESLESYLCTNCESMFEKSPEFAEDYLNVNSPWTEAVTCWCERTKCYRCGGHTEEKSRLGAPWCEPCTNVFRENAAPWGDFYTWADSAPLKTTWLGPRWSPPTNPDQLVPDKLAELKEAVEAAAGQAGPCSCGSFTCLPCNLRFF